MRALPLLLISSVWLVASSCPPHPDLDGTREGAVRLTVNRSLDGVLDCAANDCADWFRSTTPEQGTLNVLVRALAGGPAIRRFAVVLQDASGNALDRSQNFGGTEVKLSAPVSAAEYYFAVAANDPQDPLSYSITAEFVPLPPPPPPPEPRFETLRAAVLEVEGWGTDPQAVLIELGRRDGMQPGLRGRLVNGEATIGEIVIDEIYPEGSRARVAGGVRSPVTSKTRAEIDVPIESGEDLETEGDSPE